MWGGEQGLRFPFFGKILGFAFFGNEWIFYILLLNLSNIWVDRGMKGGGSWEWRLVMGKDPPMFWERSDS